MKKARLIMADDHPLFIDGLRRLVENEFDVIGTASDGRVVVEMAERLHPDVVTLDISMPGMNGFEAARHIRNMFPRIRILIVSVHTNPDYVREAFRAGASGYVSKTAPGAELLKALGEVARGNTYPASDDPSSSRANFTRARSEMFRELTPRQREVLQLVAEGKSAKMIAGILGISSKTVEFHKASMLAALQVQTTADLIRYAVERGIVGSAPANTATDGLGPIPI